MTTNQLWGEFETEDGDDTVMQNVNFSPIIELGLQNIPEIPITVKTSPIELPTPNLITHTIQLHAYSKELLAIIEQNENTYCEDGQMDTLNIPNAPPEPILKSEHETIPPINFLPKQYCDFSLGKGPVILPFTPESHKRALKQCAAIGIGHIGFATCTNTALDTVADALDIYMTNMCKLMRTAVDREASGLKSGFPDVVSKVFADLNVGNLHEFYENRVVRYNSIVKNNCEDLRNQCEVIAIGDIAPQLKLEEVPELHFPAVLDDAFTPSLEPGFQMLQSLEQEQLQNLELLDTVTTDDIRVDVMEFTQQEIKLPTLSPTAKKKRK
ncbi:STAGA complex 65 subunit gamma-like [Pararge aegeria]|uniref:Jg25212 protein n=2 Tax=Pararge aegeria TaxID=116150 RepID=A0A8S4RYR3_9NEOP|nr:STAGA complex 65 subunit gamma-like [Pararge aegeria]CAH2242297.1 jg25212 [Pararge aegeria aegeria]